MFSHGMGSHRNAGRHASFVASQSTVSAVGNRVLVCLCGKTSGSSKCAIDAEGPEVTISKIASIFE